LCCVISACSSIPPYQELTFGGGYEDTALSDNKYEVKYFGNGFASIEGVRQMWHRRSSELCKGKTYMHNFSYNGDKEYDIHVATSLPVTYDFPTVIGIITCDK